MNNYLFSIFLLFSLLSGCINEPIQTVEETPAVLLDTLFVTAIRFDPSGNAWIGTFGKGLIKYANGTFEHLNSSHPGLPSTISDIQVDSKGNVWAGYGNGIIRYDGSTFTNFNSANSPIPDNPVSSLAIDKNDHLWFTCCRFKNGGFGKYDGSAWKIYTPENSALPVNFVQSIAVDKNDQIWLSVSQTVNEAYLVRISGNTWKVLDNTAFGFTPYSFLKIAVNSSNEVFCGIDYSLAATIVNPGAGILKFDGQQFERIDMEDTFIIKSLKIDKADKIWCGDASGKMRYGVFTGQNWIYGELSQKLQGIFAVEQAPDGRIWLGTSKGIHIVPNNLSNITY